MYPREEKKMNKRKRGDSCVFVKPHIPTNPFLTQNLCGSHRVFGFAPPKPQTRKIIKKTPKQPGKYSITHWSDLCAYGRPILEASNPNKQE